MSLVEACSTRLSYISVVQEAFISIHFPISWGSVTIIAFWVTSHSGYQCKHNILLRQGSEIKNTIVYLANTWMGHPCVSIGRNKSHGQAGIEQEV